MVMIVLIYGYDYSSSYSYGWSKLGHPKTSMEKAGFRDVTGQTSRSVHHCASPCLLNNLWANHSDLTVTKPWNHGWIAGNHPQTAELFRFANSVDVPDNIPLFSKL